MAAWSRGGGSNSARRTTWPASRRPTVPRCDRGVRPAAARAPADAAQSHVARRACAPMWQTLRMSTRDEIVQAMADLPDEATIEDAMERLYLLYKIKRGLEQADAGNT